jgi:hypothetical protein
VVSGTGEATVAGGEVGDGVAAAVCELVPCACAMKTGARKRLLSRIRLPKRLAKIAFLILVMVFVCPSAAAHEARRRAKQVSKLNVYAIAGLKCAGS